MADNQLALEKSPSEEEHSWLSEQDDDGGSSGEGDTWRVGVGEREEFWKSLPVSYSKVVDFLAKFKPMSRIPRPECLTAVEFRNLVILERVNELPDARFVFVKHFSQASKEVKDLNAGNQLAAYKQADVFINHCQQITEILQPVIKYATLPREAEQYVMFYLAAIQRCIEGCLTLLHS